MRKIVIFAAAVSAFILGACNGNENVSIIGGADGPTVIYTSNGKETGLEITPLRMICVDGALYYDSGEISDITGRCGNMDGELVFSASEYEVPKDDGCCNFGGADGYQNGVENTKEIFIDNEWIIFKKSDEDKNNLKQYKYCGCVKGKMPNYETEGEFMVFSNGEDFESINEDISSEDFSCIYVLPVSLGE